MSCLEGRRWLSRGDVVGVRQQQDPSLDGWYLDSWGYLRWPERARRFSGLGVTTPRSRLSQPSALVTLEATALETVPTTAVTSPRRSVAGAKVWIQRLVGVVADHEGRSVGEWGVGCWERR